MYHYSALVQSVWDGDSITVEIDLGFHLKSGNLKIRLYGIDCPEIRGDTRAAGLEARDFLRDLIDGKVIEIKTYKDKKGKYGRYLADIYIGNIHVNAALVDAGHAVYKEY